MRSARSRGARVAVEQVSALRRTLKIKERLLAEAQALLTLSMEAKGLMLGGRGRFHGPDVRHRVCRLIDAAIADGARLAAACRILGISKRAIQRWRKPGGGPGWKS